MLSVKTQFHTETVLVNARVYVERPVQRILTPKR